MRCSKEGLPAKPTVLSPAWSPLHIITAMIAVNMTVAVGNGDVGRMQMRISAAECGLAWITGFKAWKGFARVSAAAKVWRCPSVHKRIIHYQGAYLRHLLLLGSRPAMSEKSSTGDPAIADPALAATVARPRPKADQKAQDWHRARVVIAGFFVLAAIAFLLAMATNYPTSPPTTSAMLGSEPRTGKIISYYGENKECREQAFDNKTGQMTKPEPCGLRALNSDGALVPSDSSDRLDAIRKAFSNH
jgi:hypothetical protein